MFEFKILIYAIVSIRQKENFNFMFKTDDKSPLEPKTYNKVVSLKKNLQTCNT